MADPAEPASSERQSSTRSFANIVSSGGDLPWAAEVGTLLLRIYFGYAICFGAGLSKFPLDAWFAGQVAGMGFPLPTFFAWAAALSEVAGGLLLIVGLATRLVGFFLAFTLGVAAFGFHQIAFPGLGTQHITLLYFWVFVFFTFAGAGRLSLDGLLRRRGLTALTLAVVATAGIAAYCATRTAPDPEPVPEADLSAIETIVVASSFNDWSLSETPMEQGEPGEWRATVEVAGPTAVELKFVGNGNWDLAAGESDQADARFPVSGVAEVGPAAGNIETYLPAAGSYRLRLSLPSLEYAIEAEPAGDRTPSFEEPADSEEASLDR